MLIPVVTKCQVQKRKVCNICEVLNKIYRNVEHLKKEHFPHGCFRVQSHTGSISNARPDGHGMTLILEHGILLFPLPHQKHTESDLERSRSDKKKEALSNSCPYDVPAGELTEWHVLPRSKFSRRTLLQRYPRRLRCKKGISFAERRHPKQKISTDIVVDRLIEGSARKFTKRGVQHR